MPRHSRDDQNERFDADDGNAIGLTRAFSPVDDDDAFDDAPRERKGSLGSGKHGRHAHHAAPAADGGAHASNTADASDAYDSSWEQDDSRSQDRLGGSISVFDESSDVMASSDKVPEYLHKSRRMRRILIVVIVILVVLLAAGCVLTWQLFEMAGTTATQQTMSTQDAATLGSDGETEDASTATTKETTVPNLVSLLGLTQDEAVETLQHGAQVTSTQEVNEEGNPIKTESRVVLTSEPSDTRSGSPTVYLGLDEEGSIIQAGYSAATSSLGYGSLSFADAVRNESIIEKTLGEAGLNVPEGTVDLPEDKMEYSTYASDGTTLTKEYCSFSGEVDIDGAPHTWSAVLLYDYAMANATGNLADTIRTIYVYVNA